MKNFIEELVQRWIKNGKRMIENDPGSIGLKGCLIVLHDNGDKMFQGEWQDGVPHGRTLTWYLNGEPMHEVQFENGYLHGNWRTWSETGKLMVSAVFEFGMKVEWIEWDEEGQIQYEWRAKPF